MTNEKLPGQPITVHVDDGSVLSGEYSRSGWVVSEPPPAEDDPADDPADAPELSEPQHKTRRGTHPHVPAPEAEPTTEQAEAPLDPPKE